ncbi:hypothetical protein [Gemmobacter caeruleus]|uniref:hypothetical protein n=1 Tax=Gemmobacter caeruleus TaxID=2595004 RepID=UPI0011EBEEA9|nr:hypothetical protein [Gemmobacter caeruleus]
MTHDLVMAPLGQTLQQLVAAFGWRRVFVTTLTAGLRMRRDRRVEGRLEALDEHIRRDMGLPPKAAPPVPPPPLRGLW